MNVSQEEIFAVLDERHTSKVRNRLWNASVSIAGLGGLGSNTALALARAGVGHFLLVDFDVVDLSNLNRQAYFRRHLGMKKTQAMKELIEDVNPYIDVEINDVKVDETNAAHVFEGTAVLCEAFDDAAAKAMLVNSVLECLPDVKIVSGSGMAGWGNSNSIKTEKISEQLYMCGDGISGIEKGLHLMAPRVSICAGHQANQVIEIILSDEHNRKEVEINAG